MPEVFTAGNTGDKVRSDCRVSLSPEQSGGIRISLQSKVKVLYGKDIERLVLDVLKHFGIEHASVSVEDSGALPFVIAARIEAAARQLTVKGDAFILLPVIDENRYHSSRDRFRFTRLYLPGNTP